MVLLIPTGKFFPQTQEVQGSGSGTEQHPCSWHRFRVSLQTHFNRADACQHGARVWVILWKYSRTDLEVTGFRTRNPQTSQRVWVRYRFLLTYEQRSFSRRSQSRIFIIQGGNKILGVVLGSIPKPGEATFPTMLAHTKKTTSCGLSADLQRLENKGNSSQWVWLSGAAKRFKWKTIF